MCGLLWLNLSESDPTLAVTLGLMEGHLGCSPAVAGRDNAEGLEPAADAQGIAGISRSSIHGRPDAGMVDPFGNARRTLVFADDDRLRCAVKAAGCVGNLPGHRLQPVGKLADVEVARDGLGLVVAPSVLLGTAAQFVAPVCVVQPADDVGLLFCGKESGG